MIDRHVGRKDETQFGLTCPTDLRRRFNDWCADHQQPIGAAIREAIAAFLDAYGRQTPPYLATRQPYVEIHFWLRDELAERFIAKAVADGVSQSSLLITALEQLLQRADASGKESRERKKKNQRRRSRGKATTNR